jgi:DNA-binding GntR family transcriptional regulator
MDSNSHKVRQAIEREIAMGIATPGQRLDEVTLAARFKVSRTPVREALQQLALSGMIELRPRRGAIVTDVSPERLFQMFEAMAELEALTAMMAVRRMTAGDLARIRTANAACAGAMDDPDRYYAANEAFHQAIYAASGNVVLAEQCLSLQRRLQPYRRMQLHVPARVARSFEEHEAVIDAMTNRDGALAAAQLKAHVTVQGERFADLVASLARLKAAA